jgi:hypothetical protein
VWFKFASAVNLNHTSLAVLSFGIHVYSEGIEGVVPKVLKAP